MLAPHAAADLNLGPFYGSLRYDAPYPATLKLSSKDAHITLKKVFSIMRDAYEGTQFSPSESLAGGPFGTPDRYDGVSNHRDKISTILSHILYRAKAKQQSREHGKEL